MASPSSANSSPSSYHTAQESDRSILTSASSPAQGQPCPYRAARALPRELKEHCQIFLEEQLYTSAYYLLTSILASGSSRKCASTKAVAIPPPSHLALFNTLIIHPLHTTRAETSDQLYVSSLALAYLRNLLDTVGPIGANFRSAFQFYSTPRWSRRGNYSAQGSEGETSDGGSDPGRAILRGRMANDGSVWRRGQDFWSTVGWAFNCSSLYPQRWRYWKIWLEFMLEVLEADWKERERLDTEENRQNATVGAEEAICWKARSEAMILMYMEQQTGPQGGFKDIMKALFADGGSISMSAFREVFEREPRGPKKQGGKRKRDSLVVDIENDKFGDYLVDEETMSSGVSEPPTPQKPRQQKGLTFGESHAGLAESVDLRLRLFHLISEATCAQRKHTDISRLYESFAVSLKVVPLELFALFISRRPNGLTDEMCVTILKELFHLLLISSHKNPMKVDPVAERKGSLTTVMMQHCYMPYSANTVSTEDNAKLSLVVERSIQLLWMGNTFEYSKDLAAAAQTGIEARRAKVKKRRNGKVRADAEEVLAQDMLTHSEERIQILMEAIEMSG